MKLKGPPRRSCSVAQGRDWLCRYCFRSYLSSNSLVYHVRMMHKEEPTLQEFIKAQFKNADEGQKKDQIVVKPKVIFIEQSTETPSETKSEPLEDFRDVFECLVQNGYISIPATSRDCKQNFLYQELSDYLYGSKNEKSSTISFKTIRTNIMTYQKVSNLGAASSQESYDLINVGHKVGTVDQALSTYLNWLSSGTDKQRFKLSIKHILLYRDCLNEIGHSKLGEVVQLEEP